MHFCGIIIKPESMSVEEARRTLGDKLVKYEKSDWYSVDNYRERLFDNEQTISLVKFKPIFKSWLKETKTFKPGTQYILDPLWPLIVIKEDEDQEYWTEEHFIPNDFYEFYDFKEERRLLMNNYIRAFKKVTPITIDNLLEEDTNYEVVLLDYHN